MNVEQFLQQLSLANAKCLAERKVEIEFDCDPNCPAILHEGVLMDALSSILQYAAECSPVGGRVSLSAFSTPLGTEFEIADSSDLTAALAKERSFVLSKASRDLQSAGISLNVLNCPQGGVAYSVRLPQESRAAA